VSVNVLYTHTYIKYILPIHHYVGHGQFNSNSNFSSTGAKGFVSSVYHVLKRSSKPVMVECQLSSGCILPLMRLEMLTHSYSYSG